MTNANELNLHELDQVSGGWADYKTPAQMRNEILQERRIAVAAAEKDAATMVFNLTHFL
jgi:hypothetical protein